MRVGQAGTDQPAAASLRSGIQTAAEGTHPFPHSDDAQAQARVSGFRGFPGARSLPWGRIIRKRGRASITDLNLEIGCGMFGLLGPNGAGKSTLMRTIAALQAPDSGSILFDGVDITRHPQAVRERLGYLPQAFGVYPNISALDACSTRTGLPSRSWSAIPLRRIRTAASPVTSAVRSGSAHDRATDETPARL